MRVSHDHDKELRNRIAVGLQNASIVPTEDAIDRVISKIGTEAWIMWRVGTEDFMGVLLESETGPTKVKVTFRVTGLIFNAGSVKVHEIMKLKTDDIRVGMRLSYKGDRVPFVTTFLLKKGEKNGGLWLLPAYKLDDRRPGGKDWFDLPGPLGKGKYIVTNVETGRTDKRGKPLPDMAHIRCEEWVEDLTIALRLEDVVVKFDFHSVEDDVITDCDGNINAIASAHTDRLLWEQQVRESGW